MKVRRLLCSPLAAVNFLVVLGELYLLHTEKYGADELLMDSDDVPEYCRSEEKQPNFAAFMNSRGSMVGSIKRPKPNESNSPVTASKPGPILESPDKI